MKYLITILFLLFSTICTYGQTTTFVIDPAVKSKVEKKIKFDSQFRSDDYLIYLNTRSCEEYVNDSLAKLIKWEHNIRVLFCSYYNWSNDTLKIDGVFGLFGGIGFTLKVKDGKAQLYHLVDSSPTPYYASTATDSLVVRLEVPCTESHVILSQIPDPLSRDTVYGYVDFKSVDYYSSSGFVDGEEILPRRKWRDNMRIYFMSKFFDKEKYAESK